MLIKFKTEPGLHAHPLIEMNGASQTSFNLENPLVHDYMRRMSYTEAEVRNDVYTKMGTYWKINEETDNQSFGEKPNPVLIFGTGSRVVVTDADDPTFVIQETITSGVTPIYNLIPGRSYNWKIYNSRNAVSKTGSFTTEGQLRMIKLPLQNFRDLGGWPCGNGQKVAYGRLYRGFGWLRRPEESSWRSIDASIDTDVVDTFVQLGITLDLDLRNTSKTTAGDRASDPGYPASSGIRYQMCSTSQYTKVFGASNSYFSGTKAALEYIASELSSGGGVYFHCKTGYDRTGTLSAIILALLGVSLSDIVKEYDLSLLNGIHYSDQYKGDKKNFGPFLTILLNRSEGTLKDKVYGWVTGTGTWKVGSTTYTELGVSSSVIDTLRNQLLVNA